MSLDDDVSDRAVPRRSRVGERLGGIAFVAAYILVSWSVYYLWCRFQLVQVQAVDYVVLCVIALAVPYAILVRAAAREQCSVLERLRRPQTGRSAFGGAVITALLGGAVLQVANGLLDPHPAHVFASVLVRNSCKSGFTLRGAPVLPTADNVMDLQLFALDGACVHAREGDTVFVAIKPGLLGRLWVKGYRVQPLLDVAQQALAHHRALVAHLQAEGRLARGSASQ